MGPALVCHCGKVAALEVGVAHSCCNTLLERSVSSWISVLQAAPVGEGTSVDLRVLICARCAKVLTDGDRGTDISSSEITQVRGSKFKVTIIVLHT